MGYYRQRGGGSEVLNGGGKDSRQADRVRGNIGKTGDCHQKNRGLSVARSLANIVVKVII